MNETSTQQEWNKVRKETE